jgi:hypothetical protein
LINITIAFMYTSSKAMRRKLSLQQSSGSELGENVKSALPLANCMAHTIIPVPELRIYKVWDKPIGPHPLGMFEVNLFTPGKLVHTLMSKTELG